MDFQKDTRTANFLASSGAGGMSTSTDRSSGSGYVTIRTHEDVPIFTKQKMKLNIPQDITHVAVSNNWLNCLMSHQVLLRLFLLRPALQNEVPLDKYLGGYSVSKVYLDPTGNHLFLTLIPKTPGLSYDLLYIHSKSNKPKRIDKFRDHEITAIGFNTEMGNESTTGPIIIGTSKGQLFEAEFTSEGDKIIYKKMIFDFAKDNPSPIQGLNFFRIPNSTTYIVLVATADRLYKFHETMRPDERLSLQTIFSSYVGGELFDMFEQMETKSKFSFLRFNSLGDTKYPLNFGWLTGGGILYGELSQTSEFLDYLLNKELISLPTNKDNVDFTVSPNRRINQPKSFVLTNFHALIIFSDRITAVCLLNHEVIYDEYINIDQHGRLLDVIKDNSSGSVYFYTTKFIFRYRIQREHRNVWKLYLDKSEYDLAEKYAKDNPEYLDIVRGQKADDLFAQKQYLQSAEIYSKTKLTFERICLKFVDLEDKRPLMIYLKTRLEHLKDEDLTQITMLVIWLIELFLTEISKSKDSNEWQTNLEAFLINERVSKCVRSNRSVIYDIMAAHGDNFNMSMLATANKDFESVINQHINQKKYLEALKILKVQNSPELFYKYCPILMEQIPTDTINALRAQDKRLNPEKLIPTLVCLQSDKHVQEVIRYLEYAIYSLSVAKVSVHNFLLKLCAEHNTEKLLTYLETQGRDISLVHYDVKYALRVCQEHEALSACVFLHCLLEMWEPAVELALKFNINLAKETASQPKDMEVKRKLWLKIAQHEIKGSNDVKKALELLNECELQLRIEDLLPFFSDFEKIDDFKDAICDALKNYNMKIQELQRDMEESYQNADRVRDDLAILKNRSTKISSQEKCSICELYLLLKPFFVFPCGHKFHGDCLEKQILPLLTSEQSRKLTSLKQQLETNFAVQQPNSSTQNRDNIKYEIESLLASDCLYCGVMIDSLDKPFIENWDQVNVDWE